MGEADERSPLTDKSLIKVVLANLNFKRRNGSGSERIEGWEIGDFKFFRYSPLSFVNCALKKPTSIKGGEEDFIPFHIDQRFVSHREDPHECFFGGGEDHNYELKHTLPTPWYGQYLTHTLNHNTKTVAAMDSCFVLVRIHQHSITSTVSLTITDPASTTKASAKHSFVHMCMVAVGREPQAVCTLRSWAYPPNWEGGGVNNRGSF